MQPVVPVRTPAGLEPAFDLAAYYPVLIYAAVVIGLLAWMALGGQMTLFAAEVNVVRKERLWPRSLFRPPLTEADEQAYRRAAIQEERRPEESVKVRFDEESPAEAEHADRSERERVRDVEERDASAGS